MTTLKQFKTLFEFEILGFWDKRGDDVVIFMHSARQVTSRLGFDLDFRTEVQMLAYQCKNPVSQQPPGWISW